LDGSRTRLHYDYAADVGGKVAAVGQRMLGTVTDYLIGQFFNALERRIAPRAAGGRGLLGRLFGVGGTP
jgi:carbon monoxide dehydrogenase subunit G